MLSASRMTGNVTRLVFAHPFLQLTSLAMTLESAVFLAKGNLGLSLSQIAELSKSKYDYNADVVRSLAQQRAETWVGIVLLLLAFALQVVSELGQSRPESPTIRSRSAVAAAVATSAALFIIAWFAAGAWTVRTNDTVMKILVR